MHRLKKKKPWTKQRLKCDDKRKGGKTDFRQWSGCCYNDWVISCQIRDLSKFWKGPQDPLERPVVGKEAKLKRGVGGEDLYQSVQLPQKGDKQCKYIVRRDECDGSYFPLYWENKLWGKLYTNNVLDSNFKPVGMRSSAFCRIIDPRLILYPFPLFLPLISSPLSILFPFLSLVTGKLQMTLFLLPYHFRCFHCCYIFSKYLCQTQETRWLERKQRNRRMLWRGKWREKNTSDSRGGFQDPSWT